MSKSQIAPSLEKSSEFIALIESRDFQKVIELGNSSDKYDHLRYRYATKAIKNKDMELLKVLYKGGISTIIESQISTLDHFAASYGLEFVKFLHANGHDLYNKDGLLLHKAIENENYDIAEYLLSLDDEIKFPEKMLLEIGFLDKTVEYYNNYIDKKQELKARSMDIFKQKKANIKSRKASKIKAIKR